MKITSIEYMLKVRPPLRIGAGVQIGVLNIQGIDLDLRYVPGNTLRGLIGLQLLKTCCIKLNEGKPYNCMSCDVEDCAYRDLILNRNHGEGAYFHFGKIEEKIKSNIVHMVTLDKRAKTVMKGLAPFSYEVVVPLNGNHFTIRSRILLVNSDKYINDVKNAIKLAKFQGLGGKRSIGWGFIEEAKIISQKTIEIDTESYAEINATVETPIPLMKGKSIEESIRKALEDTVYAFLKKKIKKCEIILRGKYQIKPVTYWSEAERKPYVNMAIAPQTKIKIKLEEKIQGIKTILTHIGITHNNTWYTKAGYGVLQVI